MAYETAQKVIFVVDGKVLKIVILKMLRMFVVGSMVMICSIICSVMLLNVE